MKFQYHVDSGRETRIVQFGRDHLQLTYLNQHDLYFDPVVAFIHRIKYREIYSGLDHKISIVTSGDASEIIDFIQKRAKGSFWLKHRQPKYGISATNEAEHYFNINFKRKEDALTCMMRFKDVRYES